MAKKRFALRTKPDEVHTFTQKEVRDGFHVGSECGAVGGVDERAISPEEIEFTDRELTCEHCLGAHWNQNPGAEEAWLEARGHSRNLAWRKESPAPQVDRRETY